MTTAPHLWDERDGAQQGNQLGKRRIMAVVLPQLLPELALTELSLQARPSSRGAQGRGKSVSLSSLAFAVVVANTEREGAPVRQTGWLPGMGEPTAKAELQPKTRIDAVSHRARQFGVRPGQSLAEARALLSELQLCELSCTKVQAALARIADSLSRFASVVSFDEGVCQPSEANRDKSAHHRKHHPGERSSGKRQAVSPNQHTRSVGTVWLDITGIGHLFGGERELSREVVSTVQALGHAVRVAVANGPILAQALACWPSQDQTIQVLSDEEVKASVRWLPITALPVEPETQTWLARLGVLTFADLEKLPRHLTASRLGASTAHGGPRVSRVLDLLQGKDDEPLKPYVPQALPVESVNWEEPITGSEPLLFALRGLTAKVCARLDGRGLAARRMRVTVTGDRAIARLQAARADWHTEFELVTPLYRADELWKVMSPRLSRAPLETPSIGLRLEVLELATRQERQLSLVSADTKLEGASPEKMAVLFGSLAAELGSSNFGVLGLVDSHRPERRSVLQPVHVAASAPAGPVGSVVARGKKGRRGRDAEVELDTLQTLLPGMNGRPSNDVVFGDGEIPPTRLLDPPRLLEQPVLEQPVLEQPVLEQPVLEQPVLEQPVLEQPGLEQPRLLEQPGLEQPEQPMLEQSAQPGLQQPGLEQPEGRARAAFEVGGLLKLGQELYSIQKVDFVHRIDGVEWWSRTPASRDYFRLCLLCAGTAPARAGVVGAGSPSGRAGVVGAGSPSGRAGVVGAGSPSGRAGVAGSPGRAGAVDASAHVVDALVFVDRANGERYVQGFYD